MSIVRFKRPPIQTPDWESRFGGTHAHRTGRSWWALRYTDGKIVHEWDPDPGSPNGHVDWPRLPRRGRQALRLYCPNRQMVELGGRGSDQTGKLFQLKVKIRAVAIGAGLPDMLLSDNVQAHMVGIVHGVDGQCLCYAWEPLPPPEPPGLPMPPNPDDYNDSPPGSLANAYDAWRASVSAAKLKDIEAWQQYKAMEQAWKNACGGRLVGPWDDNVYHIRYHNIGMLSALHLGLDDGER